MSNSAFYKLGISGYSGFSGSGISGYSGYSGTGTSGYSGFAGVGIRVSVTENFYLQEIVGTVVTKAGTVTGTAGVGSSLFLQRIMLPATMNLSEIHAAMSINFPATNQGAGTMSRSMVVYSFGNSTSLGSVVSASGNSVWSTGTSTTAGATSLTQFQGGWDAPTIQQMTFVSSSLAAGEYVVGQLFNFAQGSSTWTLGFYGANAASSIIASAATNLTSATLGALSSGGFSAASAITGFGSYATGVAGGTFWGISAASNAASSLKTTFSTSTTLINMPHITALSTLAGSFHTATGSLGAVTNVGLGALNSTTLAQLTLPNFQFIGTGSGETGVSYAFVQGIMSTGAIPTNITLSSTAVTYTGSIAHQQPWFRLVGA